MQHPKMSVDLCDRSMAAATPIQRHVEAVFDNSAECASFKWVVQSESCSMGAHHRDITELRLP